MKINEPFVIDRRKFLKTSTLLSLSGCASLLSQSAFSSNLSPQNNKYIYDRTLNYGGISNDILPETQNSEEFWKQPRKIFIQRKETGERASLFYHVNGQINPEHYWIASYLLRDVNQQKMVYVDTKLLDLLCAVQSWLAYLGFNNPILVSSGFRTIKTNSMLEGAVKNSMHLKGMAVDFTVPGLNLKDVARIAAHFQAGGVGLYTNKNFIHLDTGGVRTWIN